MSDDTSRYTPDLNRLLDAASGERPAPTETGLSAIERELRPELKRDQMAVTASDQIVHRAKAAMADVHAHALRSLGDLERRIEHLKEKIEAQRTEAEAGIEKFVDLVNDSMLAAGKIDEAIGRIEKAMR